MDFTSTAHRSHFGSTSISLRFHFCLTSNSFRSHFDLASFRKPQYGEVLDKRTNKIKTVKVVAAMKSKERFQFKRGTLTKDIITQNVPRSIKSTVKEKRNIDGFESKPFGWVPESHDPPPPPIPDSQIPLVGIARSKVIFWSST